jgi:protein O-GlcNAc transferase
MINWIKHQLYALKREGTKNVSEVSRQEREKDMPECEDHSVLIQTYRKRGNEFLEQDRLNDAEACYREALRISPDYAEGYITLGFVLAEQKRYLEAENYLRQGLGIDPGMEDAFFILGTIDMARNKLDDAIDNFEQAVALRPNFLEALDQLGDLYRNQGLLKQAIDCCRQQLSIDPTLNRAYSNLLLVLQYDPDICQEEVFSEYLRFAERFEQPLKAYWRPHANNRDPNRLLRVGYISPDFRTHSVAPFILPILSSHDKSQFEIWCYHNHPSRDGITEKIEGFADRFVPCVELSDEHLAERIRADEIDILVDLTGHTGGNRLLVFARKPAPIQVTWIGLPATTGLSSMDYRITDSYMDPPGMTERFHSETLVRLPMVAPFDPSPMAKSPPVNELPALASGELTLASLNNLLKVNARTIRVWARILAALPQARLILANVNCDRTRLRLLSAFEREGIAPDRLMPYSKLPFMEYLALHHRIDLALDPFPYNGGTTSLHSLWMGVPMITLEGKSTPSRAGYMLMQTVGLPEFIATSEEEYVQRAVRWAGNLPRLNQVRQELRGRLSANLIDKPSAPLVRDVEKAFRDMWKTWVGES